MKKILLALAALTVSALAQATPEEAAEMQLKSMRNADWAAFAATMQPAAMERFQTLMVQAAEAAAGSDSASAKRAVDQVFGGLTGAKIKAMKPAAYFELFMKNFATANPGLLDHYKQSEVKFIGHVESEGLAYVVSTVTRTVGEHTVKAANTGAFVKEGEVWKSALSGELEMFATGIIAQFVKK